MLVTAFCDRTGASPQARAQWIQDVEGTPPELRGDLHAYLLSQLPAPLPAPPKPQTAPVPAPIKPMGWLHLDQPWRIADRLYQHHHWNCPICTTAARGHADRCAEGLRLHDDYNAQAAAAIKGSDHEHQHETPGCKEPPTARAALENLIG